MYPEHGFESVQRITVPECIACKAIWQDAEDDFRSFMVFAAPSSNEYSKDQWNGPISRAHQRDEDGLQRMESILQCLHPSMSSAEREVRFFPHLNDKIYLVVRKMVRGLCHHHGFATAMPDKAVIAGLFPNSPPEGAEPVSFDFMPGVFRYSYFYLHQQPRRLHMHWLLTFYEQISFLGIVSTTRNLEWEASRSKAGKKTSFDE